MNYTIKFDDLSNLWIMDGQAERFVGEHLYKIAKDNGITTTANSESHHLAIIKGHGIEVDLLESDGSKACW